jgi:hypothetical protein
MVGMSNRIDTSDDTTIVDVILSAVNAGREVKIRKSAEGFYVFDDGMFAGRDDDALIGAVLAVVREHDQD